MSQAFILLLSIWLCKSRATSMNRYRTNTKLKDWRITLPPFSSKVKASCYCHSGISLPRSETRPEMQFFQILQLQEGGRRQLKHTHFPGNIHLQSLERVECSTRPNRFIARCWCPQAHFLTLSEEKRKCSSSLLPHFTVLERITISIQTLPYSEQDDLYTWSKVDCENSPLYWGRPSELRSHDLNCSSPFSVPKYGPEAGLQAAHTVSYQSQRHYSTLGTQEKWNKTAASVLLRVFCLQEMVKIALIYELLTERLIILAGTGHNYMLSIPLWFQ